MKINIEINTKELDTLMSDKEEPIEYNFNIDLFTEARSEITHSEETAIYAGLFWALATMLPYTIIQLIFTKWNNTVKELREGLKEGKQVIINTLNIEDKE